MRIFDGPRVFDGAGGGGGGPPIIIASSDSSVTVTEAPAGTFDLTASAATVGALPTSGGTMTGSIDMGGNSVINERLVTLTTGISASTAGLGLADRYVATAAGITVTISTADIVDGRRFVFAARNAGVSVGTPVTIDTEGGESIDAAASITLDADYASATLVARGGNLESEN